MNCCSTVVCLDICGTLCPDSGKIELPGLFADVTGTWTFVIEFAGARLSYTGEYVQDEQLWIPPDYLNENYSHLIKVYRRTVANDPSTYSLFNNTCYSIRTIPTASRPGIYTPTAPTALAGSIETVVDYNDIRFANNGVTSTFSDARLNGSKYLIVVVEKDTLFKGIGETDYQYSGGSSIAFNFVLAPTQTLQIFYFK